MSKKDPAFLFYPKDWIQGTAKLMPDEKGVYIDLLAHQHQDKDLPNDTKRLSRIAGLSEQEFLLIWDSIKDKFTLNSNNRLVNRKLTDLMTERSEKGWKNKIIGTLASVVRLSEYSYDIKYQAKKTFDYTEFWDTPETELTESITEWYTKRLKSIGNGNEDGNANDNKEGNTNNKLWFLKYYHSSYDNYKEVFNGQSTTELMFKEWKVFIDFIYENKYEEIFESKFVSPHDFAKLIDKNNFTKDKWASVIKSLLSTGIKPEHNLFFRIPKFMEYGQQPNGNGNSKPGVSEARVDALKKW